MKPLTSDTLAKAAIIEGYCWEIAALEVDNKNTEGARYFMSLADSLHRMYELGHDGEEAPSAPEQPLAQSGTEILRRIRAPRDEPPGGSPSIPAAVTEAPVLARLR